MIARKILSLYLRQSGRVWRRLPDRWRGGSLAQAYGNHLHRLVCRYSERNQSHATFFLRNRAELNLLCRLLERQAPGSTVNLSVLACSKGAEVYSIAWAIRSSRPDLRLRIHAIDISREIVEFAEKGVYSLARPPAARGDAPPDRDVTWRDQPPTADAPASMFQGVTREEMEAMFEVQGDQAMVRPWLKEGISWIAADASDSRLPERIGLQDIVVANRFLCHMRPAAARTCLASLGRLLQPGGHLFVSGVDLNVRTETARQMGWKPVTEMMREVHEGDGTLREGWPMDYWGLEPFSERARDWQLRYASVFQVGAVPQARIAMRELASR